MFEGIKAERTMTLNHWRYRILHWCFGVNAPEADDEEKDLPNFLYTHYCPLFHVTNLIFIFAPVIFLCKLAIRSGVMFSRFVAMPIIHWFVEMNRKMEAKKAETLRLMTPEECKNREFIKLRGLMSKCMDRHFDFFWLLNKEKFEHISKEEAREKYEAEEKRLLIFEREKLKAKNTRRDKIVKYVDLGRKVVFGILTLVLLSLFSYLGYLIYQHGLDVIKTVYNFLMSLDYSAGMPYVAGLALAAVGMYVAYRKGILEKLADKSYELKERLERFRPLYKFFMAITYPVRKLFEIFLIGCETVCDFSSMFYADNCPPITIIEND